MMNGCIFCASTGLPVWAPQEGGGQRGRIINLSRPLARKCAWGRFFNKTTCAASSSQQRRPDDDQLHAALAPALPLGRLDLLQAADRSAARCVPLIGGSFGLSRRRVAGKLELELRRRHHANQAAHCVALAARRRRGQVN